MLPLPLQIKNKVSDQKDRLMLTQSNMVLSNFGVDEQGKTVLMEFGEIGLLPETFVAYAVSSHHSLAPISRSLGLSNGSNASMARVCGYFGMISDPKLSLNEDGYPNNGNQREPGPRG